MAKALFKYVNATGQLLSLPGRGGGRITLRDGEFVTDPYYEFMARSPGERGSTTKVLMKIPAEMDVEQALMAPVTIASRTAPVSPGIPHTPTANDGVCATSCESTCMTMSEVDVVAKTEDINAEMDKDSSTPETTKKQASAESAVPQSDTESTGQATATSSSSVEASPPETPHDAKEGSTESASDIDIKEVEEVLEFCGFSNTDVKDIEDHCVVVEQNGKTTFCSRLELGWTTSSKRSNSRHINKVLNK